MRRALIALPLLALAACETTNSDEWSGGDGTPFKQAERSCLELTESIEASAEKRDFFIGCMGALGWAPKPDATIEF